MRRGWVESSSRSGFPVPEMDGRGHGGKGAGEGERVESRGDE